MYDMMMALVRTHLEQAQKRFNKNPHNWGEVVEAMAAYQHLTKNISRNNDPRVPHMGQIGSGGVVAWLSTYPNRDLRPTETNPLDTAIEGGARKLQGLLGDG